MARYVREIMATKLITLDSDDSVMSAHKLMEKHSVHSVLIPPKQGGRVWSIFTDTDFLLALDSGSDPNVIHVGEYASPVSVTADVNWTVDKAREQMVMHGVKHLPVVDDARNVIGIISSTDIIRQYTGF